jgi:hypothetical protein
MSIMAIEIAAGSLARNCFTYGFGTASALTFSNIKAQAPPGHPLHFQ